MLDAGTVDVKSRARRLAVGSAVACAAFVLACLAGEWALELAYPLTSVPADASIERYFAALGGSEPDTDAALTMPIRGADAPWVKGPGIFRAVILGESSSLGVPYVKNFSFGSFFVKGMKAVDPSKTCEQLYLGENGRSSAGVVHFLDTAFGASPDVIVVYSGHNEFTFRLTMPSPFGRARNFPWNWLPRFEDGFRKVKDDGSVHLKSDALAAVPSRHRAELSMALGVLCQGNREKYPWANFPIGARERQFHAERYERNLRTIVDRARQRGIPLVFVRPTSHMQCAPLASGQRFDPAASAAFAAAEKILTADPVKARDLYIEARDRDPAPVRMVTAHRQVFDRVMSLTGASWIDGDACAERVVGGPILGDTAFVDFMHPRENVHAELALELAGRFHELGLTGVDVKNEAAVRAFREACCQWRTENIEEVAKGDAKGLRWFIMMYLVFGNPAAAQARALADSPEHRTLEISLLLDLASRWRGDEAVADRELDAARERHPDWRQTLDEWRKTVDRAR